MVIPVAFSFLGQVFSSRKTQCLYVSGSDSEFGKRRQYFVRGSVLII